jgi:antirestriction protein ArdC
MAKFHRYSARNCLLIHFQRPEATMVAGFDAWKKKFHRHVLAGEKGITIIGYALKSTTLKKPLLDEKGEPVIGDDGKPAIEYVKHSYPVYFPVYVYDVSQTEGEPLPQLVHDLEGDVASYQDFLASCRKLSPYPIEFGNIASPNVRGYCSFEEQRIVVRSGLSQVQTAKTVLHEITHAILHNEGDAKTTAEKELEAESAAFVICSHYGIDTSEYTFPYLASWCRQERDKLERCLDAIQKHAFSVIEQLDASMLELEKAKADRGSLQQRLELAQAQSAIDLTRNPPSQVRNMELER